MPFEKIDAKQKIQDALKNDPEFAKGFEETKLEFEERGIWKPMAKAEELFVFLQNSQSMPDIGDCIDSMDEETAKLVLRKFVYSRK